MSLGWFPGRRPAACLLDEVLGVGLEKSEAAAAAIEMANLFASLPKPQPGPPELHLRHLLAHARLLDDSTHGYRRRLRVERS